MEQNEQIEGMPMVEIRKLLNLLPFEQFESQQRVELKERMVRELGTELAEKQKTRNTGRTTKMLAEAFHEMTRGRKVAICFSSEAVGKLAVDTLDSWCGRAFTTTGKRVHNLARAVTDPNHVDQNETLFLDHSYEKSNDAKTG